MTSNEKELAILDCNLVVEGDFTVNGTIYNVDKKQYTGRELISKILPPINLNTTAFFYKKAYNYI